jgi:hypothetical protein
MSEQSILKYIHSFEQSQKEITQAIYRRCAVNDTTSYRLVHNACTIMIHNLEALLTYIHNIKAINRIEWEKKVDSL